MRLEPTPRRLVSVSLLAAGVVLAGRAYRRRVRNSAVWGLRERAHTGRTTAVTEADVADLPDPVRTYLERSVPVGSTPPSTARFDQRGRLRIDHTSDDWKRFGATHYVTVDPPGFLWDASVDVAPCVSVGVRDLLCDGRGEASVSLYGVVPVERTGTSPELVEADLQRYLAEAVWYPTALLPRAGVQWDPVDDDRARATVEHGGVSASLTFSFDDGEVTQVGPDPRYRWVGDGYEATPWSGHWSDYEWRDGLRIPTEGSVVWHLSDGDFRAWEGRLTDVAYDPW